MEKLSIRCANCYYQVMLLASSHGVDVHECFHQVVDHWLWRVVATFGLVLGLGLSPTHADEQPAAISMDTTAIPRSTTKTGQICHSGLSPPPETAARWQPLIDYLNNANLGRRVELVALGQRTLKVPSATSRWTSS
jgi:hypothetical protein